MYRTVTPGKIREFGPHDTYYGHGHGHGRQEYMQKKALCVILAETVLPMHPQYVHFQQFDVWGQESLADKTEGSVDLPLHRQ